MYAIFNAYYLQPIFLNKRKTNYLFQNKLDKFDAEEINCLYDKAILIKNNSIDNKIIDIIKDEFNKQIKNKITIMYIIPTNTCNLECKYCFIGKMNENKILMKNELAYKAVDLFSNHLKKIKEEGTIFFYGAEPLINFELINNIVSYCKEKKYNIKFSMVTNLLLINDRIINFIKENNISIGVSIDGPKEVTDFNRIYKNSKKGIYDDLIKKIQLLKNNNVDFGLSITISKSFIDNKYEIINWLKKLDVKNISYNLMHYTYKTDDWKEYYNNAIKFIYDSNNALFDLGFNEDRVNRKLKSFYNREFKYSDCAAVGGNQITISPNGDIDIRHGYQKAKNKKICNINDIEKLDELFENEEYLKWRDKISINNIVCQDCESIFICGGGCAKESQDLFDNFNEIDKPFCIYSKKMLKYILTELYENSINI